ncbi:MAG: hypothetical protein Q7T26_10415 [Dehalococcoidia bacterium]|nr:hypothetical protein [Dehalococcoidia bacterium]
MAICKYHMWSPTICEEQAIDSYSGFCILHYPDANKDVELFTETLRSSISKAEKNKKEKDIWIRGVVFPPRFNCLGFEAFGKHVIFVDACFLGEAWFNGVKFANGVGFSSTRFEGPAYFFLEFSNAASSWFITTVFRESVRFKRAVFPGAESKGTVRFESTVFEKPHEVFFESVDLSKTSFYGTNLLGVHFVDVTWPKVIEHPWNWLGVHRSAKLIYDDPRIHSKYEDDTYNTESLQNRYQVAGELYRQLRINMEQSKQEIEAGDFYIAQMDMRQHDPSLYRLLSRVFLPVYRFVALYGESISRPFTLYILLASLLFAPLYLWGGFGMGDIADPPYHRTILQPSAILQDGFWRDYVHAWFLAITAGLPYSPPNDLLSWFLYPLRYINILVNILLVSLIAVALRRQFKR